MTRYRRPLRSPLYGPLLAVTCLLGWCVGIASGQVRVEPVQVQTSAGPARGLVAVVDLTDPRVEVVVSAAGEGGRVPQIPTDEWAEQNGVIVAINANFFGATAPIGLAVSNGRVVSPARGVDPVLLVYPGRAAVVSGAEPDLIGVVAAVAGVGQSSDGREQGGPLVREGRNTGAAARVGAMDRHPRTAVGVDETGTRLILLAIDGRQPGWSVGMTLPELADVMIGLGAADAINLDGGGSTAFIWRREEGAVRNRPSDGKDRPVPVHLGVRLRPGAEPDAPQ